MKSKFWVEYETLATVASYLSGSILVSANAVTGLGDAVRSEASCSCRGYGDQRGLSCSGCGFSFTLGFSTHTTVGLHGDGQYGCYKEQGTTRVGWLSDTPAYSLYCNQKIEPIKQTSEESKKKNLRAKFKKEKRNWLPNTSCFRKNTIRATETQGRL